MKAIIMAMIRWIIRLFSSKKKMESKIKLKDVRDGKITLSEIIERVRSEADRDSLFADNLHTVAKAGLESFDFPSMNSAAAVEKSAKEVVSIFYPLKSTDPIAYIKKFNEAFLNIEYLPASLKQQIGAPVNLQLTDIDQLIEYYENDTVSGALIRENSTPRNHREYWMFTFYKRTQAKRQEILEYLSNTLEETALRFAKPGYRETWHGSSGTTDGIMELRDKYPYLDMVVDGYRPVLKVDMEKLDWQKLNPMRNKIFAHSFTADYSQGYTSAINAEIKTGVNAIALLDRILVQINQFPKIKGRKEIFEELKVLFTTGQWYGFYALALPQVEGIFAEMSLLVDERNSTSGSLPDKVKRMRAFSDEHEFYFDYYEFYLPEARNKFSHTGKDNDIELKSRYMLLDLSNLLTTCEGLNTPLVHLSNLIADGPDDLKHIGDLAKLVNLADETKGLPGYQEIKPALEVLVYQRIPQAWDIKAYIDSIQVHYDQALKQLSDWIRWGFIKKEQPELDFRTMTVRQVFENTRLIEETFQESGLLFSDSLKFLIDVPTATSKLLRLFPQLPQDIADAIRHFETTNKQSLNNLEKMIREADFEGLQDDYIIEKQQRMVEWGTFHKPSQSSK